MLFHYGWADNLIAGYGKGWGYHDSAEHLVVYVPLRCSTSCLSENPIIRAIFAQGLKMFFVFQTMFRQVCGFCHTFKQKHRMKSAKFAFIKTLAIFFRNIKFCKAQSRVNFWNILYLSHILVREFPRFGCLLRLLRKFRYHIGYSKAFFIAVCSSVPT